MDVFEAIERRYSVRRYQDRPIESDKLSQVLNAARLAPSAKNMQEWRFVVVSEPDTRRQLMRAAFEQSFVAEAPIVIACCADWDGYVMPCGLPSYQIDVAISVDHLTLAATALGLGTCWIGKFNPDQVRNILAIPSDVQVVQLLTMGYPADQRRRKSRMTLDSLVSWERWKEKSKKSGGNV